MAHPGLLILLRKVSETRKLPTEIDRLVLSRYTESLSISLLRIKHQKKKR